MASEQPPTVRQVVRLRSWAVDRSKGYVGLAGRAHGHPRFNNGHEVVTSRVMATDGRSALVDSGKCYLLDGDPNPAHITWLANNGLTYDRDYPLRHLGCERSEVDAELESTVTDREPLED